jgi:hypothetical protein
MSPSISIESQPLAHASGFRRHFFGAVLHVLARLAGEFGSVEGAVGQFPFLGDYVSEIDSLGWGGEAHSAAGAKFIENGSLDEDEDSVLGRLRTVFELTPRELTLLFATGLIEEDARFGALIDWAQPFAGGQHRPTLGLLTAWWREENDCSAVRRTVERLQAFGLIEVVNPEAPRLQWAFQPAQAVWDLLRDGRLGRIGWARFRPPAELPSLDNLILSPEIEGQARSLAPLIASGCVTRILIRGPRHNGRRALLGALAKQTSRGLLEVTAAAKPEDPRWTLAGTLAALLGAMPATVLDPAPGEVLPAPPIPPYAGAFGIVLPRAGAVSECHDAALIELELPFLDLRAALWMRVAGKQAAGAVLAERFRITAGNIVRCAAAARVHARVRGGGGIEIDDVRAALRAQHRPLESLAARVPASGGWSDIAAPADTMSELRGLEVRCRNRERLRDGLGPAAAAHWNCGVRALFNGPSGAGKTMAARLLASVLGLELYRLDLSSVVNKYLGETEKNLEQLLSRAEELDVVLLIDEGDALLTARTGVQNANDRYANLETNFLLQRLESFEGIVIVTTNAAQRIDTAFQRRMDVVVEFRLPEPAERWAIWQLHLPAAHGVDPRFLEEVAVRCPLSGGQIRNAVLHASTLALEESSSIGDSRIRLAVEREYRKMGAVCPLKTGGARPWG